MINEKCKNYNNSKWETFGAARAIKLACLAES